MKTPLPLRHCVLAVVLRPRTPKRPRSHRSITFVGGEQPSYRLNDMIRRMNLHPIGPIVSAIRSKIGPARHIDARIVLMPGKNNVPAECFIQAHDKGFTLLSEIFLPLLVELYLDGQADWDTFIVPMKNSPEHCFVINGITVLKIPTPFVPAHGRVAWIFERPPKKK